MNGRDRRRARQGHADRFRDAGHGACGAHHGAGPRRGRQTPFDHVDLLALDIAGAVACPEAAAVRAGAQPLALVPSGHHRAADDLNGGTPRRSGPHELGRNRLVAPAHKHHRVHRLCPDHFFRVHGHQVAEFEAGRIEEDFAQRNRWEIHRQAAGRQHAAFDGFQHFRKMPVAVVEAAAGVSDADDGLRQHFPGITHRFGERQPEVKRKIPVTVVGEPAGETFCLAAVPFHRLLPCFQVKMPSLLAAATFL
jgi:hypothetical protein